MDEKRKLTKAEQRRLDRFNAIKEELISKGYKATDITANPVRANIVGPLYGLLLSVPFIIIFILTANKETTSISDDYFRNYTIFMVLMFVFIVVHELIHGCTWAIFCKNGFRSIEFGFILKTFNPYCTCAEALNRKQYFMGLIMPCIILGFIPCVISFFNHNLWFLIMGVIMIVSAGGDLLIGKMILDHKADSDALYHDHPTDIGLICLEKE